MSIESFGDARTEAIFRGEPRSLLRRVPPEILQRTAWKLDLLETATQLQELGAFPGSHLEALKGDLAGYHSLRVNDQWRIIFRWGENGPASVRLVDYH